MGVDKHLQKNQLKMIKMGMNITKSLLVVNILQFLMIFYKIGAILNNKGYFANVDGKDIVEVQIHPAVQPVPVPAPVLKYSLIGLSLVVVLMVIIPIGIMITKRNKSNFNHSNSHSSSGHHPILDLSHEERWDYIKKKAEEIKEIDQEKNAEIGSNAGEMIEQDSAETVL